ncbi:hypothetical protein Gogos_010590, partial [Gossypium gossypioides]|nr:hypothetical protein [Gossypium gossypioides]
MEVDRIVRGPQWIHWEKPPSGMFILNTNGAFKSRLGVAFAGGLIHNDDVGWIVGLLLNIGCADSVQAELWGTHKGQMLAKRLNIRTLIVEVDAMVVVCWLQRPYMADHYFYNILQDSWNLIAEGWVLEICHRHREGNSCADHLANLAQSREPRLEVLEEPPASSIPLLQVDACGKGILRLQ